MKRENPLTAGAVVCSVTLFVLSTGFLVGVRAQTSTVGSISGTLRDPTGAVIPKTQVLIQEMRTGFSRTVVADDSGFYSAPSLPVGLYSVSATSQGFKKTTHSGIELHLGDNLMIDLSLEVGEVNEIVNVSHDAVLVETRSAEVSSLISEKQVTELPLNGRNYAQLALIVPGVSPAADFNTSRTGLESSVNMSVNGNVSNQNLWTIDGVNNMDVGLNLNLLVFPSIDSIEEFRVERNSYSAEFGQAQGAVINLITKGGTNQFHGTVFEFFRNSALNANDFFLNEAAQPKGQLRYNNFGGNFSGPILKNRVFFFWSEEWRRELRGKALSGRVPTALETIGDFSGLLTDTVPRDPLTGGPFPGNKIAADRLSPAGLALLKVYPHPNNLSDPNGSNWVAAPLEPVDSRQDLIRGDVKISNDMNLMVRWINDNWVHGAASGNFWGDSQFPTISSDWAEPSKSFAVRLTNTLGSRAVNDFQFSRAGNDIFVTTNAAGRALNEEIVSKFPTVFPHPQGSPFPTMWGTDGYGSLAHFAPWTNHEDLFIWKDDLSKVVSSHSFKAGGLFSHNIKNQEAILDGGVYPFCDTNSRTGNAIADILLKDLPLGCYYEADHPEETLGRWHDLEFYVNDTWKVRTGVTLTLGLRWSRYGQPYSANDRISNFIPGLYDGTDPLSALVEPGTRGFNRATVQTYDKGFQPRIGVAWDIFADGKTVLRLGGGRYLGRPSMETVLALGYNPPWTQTVGYPWGGGSSSLSDDPTFRSLDTINPGLKNTLITTFTAFNSVNEHVRPPESWQWNVTVSREVMKNTVLEASYVGNHALHILRTIDWNDVVPTARLGIAQAIRGNDPNAGALIDANRRLAGVGDVWLDESTGDSNYTALQISVNRRFSDRLAFQTAYTWSHAITNHPLDFNFSGATDPYNYNLDRGDADLDRRQMFVANAVYVLPSFKRWGAATGHILGDWQLSGIVSLLSGTPINVISGANTAGRVFAGNQRPNLVAGVPIYLNRSDARLQYLNPAAFSLPDVGRFGTLGRGAIRGPGMRNLDLSIVKNWRVHDHYGLQFRSEMFNAFNHANFRAVDNYLALGNVEKLPNGNLNPNFGKSLNPNFGRPTGTRGPREVQFALKFSF